MPLSDSRNLTQQRGDACQPSADGTATAGGVSTAAGLRHRRRRDGADGLYGGADPVPAAGHDGFWSHSNDIAHGRRRPDHSAAEAQIPWKGLKPLDTSRGP
jgi:hypothetical protein